VDGYAEALIKNGFLLGIDSRMTGTATLSELARITDAVSATVSATAVRGGRAITMIRAQRSKPTNNSVQNKLKRLLSAVKRRHILFIFLFISRNLRRHTLHVIRLMLQVQGIHLRYRIH
jgi:hypothetical protein